VSNDQWPPREWIYRTPASDFVPVSLRPASPPPPSDRELPTFSCPAPRLPTDVGVYDRDTRRPMRGLARAALDWFASKFRVAR
jgi:hypothetical protein